MSEYRKTIESLSASSPLVGRMPCLWCGEPTLIPTLNHLGARCQRCFDAYCAQGLRGGVDGFMQGAPDTPTQADMRKRVRGGHRVLDAAREGRDTSWGEITAALVETGDLRDTVDPRARAFTTTER